MAALGELTGSARSRACAFSVLGVRLIALYLILDGLSSLPAIVPYREWITLKPDPLQAFAALLTILAPLITGLVLWPISGWVGRHVVGLDSLASVANVGDEFFPAGIALAGVIVAVTAIPGIVKQAIDVIGAATHGDLQLPGMIYILGYRVLIGLLGLSLIFGAAGLQRSFTKLRTLGVE